MKRSSARLIARKSTTDASVTLYEAEESKPSSSELSPPPRPAKRVKLERDADETIPGPSSPFPKMTTTKLEIVEEDFKDGVKGKRRTSSKITSPKKVKPIQQSLVKPHPAPDRWKEQYDTIKEMRSRIVAPVDTMGCERAQLKETDPRSQRFSTLVSLMLSSQTKDEVTDAAVSKLRESLGGSLTVDALRNAGDSVISDAIAKVGFWRRKTQYIKQTAQRLYDDFDSDVPKTVDELCSLPGVGPKMAFLALQTAWNLNHGIGVDVHVHRITNRLKWHKPPTKNPEETRLNLQSWLPSELHAEINPMLVGFGQTICVPISPRCDLCELNSGKTKLCPSAQKVLNAKSRKIVVMSEPSDSGPKLEIAIEEVKVPTTP